MASIFESRDFDEMLGSFTPRIKEYLRKEKDYVISILKNPYWALELGCGTGRVLHFVSSRVDYTTGIDNSEIQLAKVKERFKGNKNVVVYNRDATDLSSFEGGKYDVVLGMFNFLGLFDDEGKKAVLEEARYVTKEGGHILFSVYNEHALVEQLKNYLRVGLNVVKSVGEFELIVSDGEDTELYSERFDEKKIHDLFDSYGFFYFRIIPLGDIAYMIHAIK